MDAINFELNGKPLRLMVDGERPLFLALRTDLALAGTNYGCGQAL